MLQGSEVFCNVLMFSHHRSHVDEWKSAAAMSVRNFWLLGLLLIENGDAGGALEVYDQEILPRILSSMVVVDCNDATNLLFRICLEGNIWMQHTG